MLICVQHASSTKQVIIPVLNREDGNQASANCAANMSKDGLPEVLAQLKHISQQLDRHIIKVNLKLSDIQQRMTDVEKCLQERSFPSQMTPVAEFAQPIQGAEHLCMLYRSPLVSNDEQWLELETALQDNGKDGLFFLAVVQTIKGRIRNSTDVTKSANATLRALLDESYLADRVTMAGYKKGNFYNCLLFAVKVLNNLTPVDK
jgi:hypothetical protein